MRLEGIRSRKNQSTVQFLSFKERVRQVEEEQQRHRVEEKLRQEVSEKTHLAKLKQESVRKDSLIMATGIPELFNDIQRGLTGFVDFPLELDVNPGVISIRRDPKSHSEYGVWEDMLIAAVVVLPQEEQLYYYGFTLTPSKFPLEPVLEFTIEGKPAGNSDRGTPYFDLPTEIPLKAKDLLEIVQGKVAEAIVNKTLIHTINKPDPSAQISVDMGPDPTCGY